MASGSSPKCHDAGSAFAPLQSPRSPRSAPVPATWPLYASASLALLQSMHFGWSLSQLNYSAFHAPDDCAETSPSAACLMFPGHSASQWTLAVNAWVVGGMLGSLASGALADAVGRRRTFQLNAVVMVVAAAVQSLSSSVVLFSLGRWLAGLASGAATAMPNSYINEIAPPHLRSHLGVGFQLVVAIGIVLVGSTFFLVDGSPSAWRWIAAAPVVLAGFFLLAAPWYMVESPTWLLAQGRRVDAERELTRLFGEEHVATALDWLGSSDDKTAQRHAPHLVRRCTSESSGSGDADDLESPAVSPRSMTSAIAPSLFAVAYRRQTLLAVTLAGALQLSGINVVFLYSSSLFKDAGIDDDRVGSLIVNVVNLLPSFVAGTLATRFGNRTMILLGQCVMLLSAVGLTVALLVDVALLSIVFTSLYVAGFSVSLGPLAFLVASEIFPDALRATGASLTLCVNWSCMLLIGVGYPYAASTLRDLGFLPFIATLSFFLLLLGRTLPETLGKTSAEIQRCFAA
ncbi:hypothetical protein ATCC90586_004630 [Pythium insidiosum]|nr:hypothetical protein ATCC90586_004630 [Pythium insidiosum]